VRGFFGLGWLGSGFSRIIDYWLTEIWGVGWGFFLGSLLENLTRTSLIKTLSSQLKFWGEIRPNSVQKRDPWAKYL
jgi:hypothetical protein